MAEHQLVDIIDLGDYGPILSEAYASLNEDERNIGTDGNEDIRLCEGCERHGASIQEIRTMQREQLLAEPQFSAPTRMGCFMELEALPIGA